MTIHHIDWDPITRALFRIPRVECVPGGYMIILMNGIRGIKVWPESDKAIMRWCERHHRKCLEIIETSGWEEADKLLVDMKLMTQEKWDIMHPDGIPF